jgi:lysophospholipase L1-like esterase
MSFQVRRLAVGLFVLSAGCAASVEDDQGTGASSMIEVGDRADDVDIFAGGERISLTQNSTWTIKRGAAQTVRVVGYGDSIFAGYQRSLGQVARRQAVSVAGEYLAKEWNANVEVVVRAVTGGVASEVYDRMQTEKSFMAAPSTRAVYFEMCGNDYLQARRAFEGAGGNCNYRQLDAALETCVFNTDRAMTLVNTSAPTATVKGVVALYYPGFDDDNAAARCADPSTGQRPKVQDVLLPRMARSNWRTCDLARRRGFSCIDAFAEFMAADYDSNGDGKIDSDAMRIDPAETEERYVEKVTVKLRKTLRDSNNHGIGLGTEADYLFGDNIHPTYIMNTVASGSTGSGAPDFTDAQLASGKNPKWNTAGHERMGWAMVAKR